MVTIAFLVNPIAGMGGAVGLKGTDGRKVLEEAMRRGAEPVARARAVEALSLLSGQKLDLLTCGGEMGEEALRKARIEEYDVVYASEGETSAEDTKEACRRFLEEGAALLLFCGGDGTARDILEVVGDKVPVLGIPAGVKMHSGVFAVGTEAASKLVLDFLQGKTDIVEVEVLDTDEEEYREGRLNVKLFGYAKMPSEPTLVQGSKAVFYSQSEEKAKEAIATFASEFMWDDSLYIMGAGSTLAKVAELLEIEKTLLGVDVVKNRKLIAKDVSEREILAALKDEKKAKIMVSPIGAQGFIFGRGNQQISARVIDEVGKENVIVLATPHKLEKTPILLVDTGDRKLDAELSGTMQIVTGYHMAQRREVRHV